MGKYSVKFALALTVKRYETSPHHIEAILQFRFGKNDIPVSEVDHKFIVYYEFYLRSERNCCHNSAVKYLKNFGKIVRIPPCQRLHEL
ncbi:MAG: phage integrase SAM-like domain-containing protein [Alistipes sp.]|nr:phage integrase SAM-like domain-containing protein [Alistipes sp.]